MFDFPHKLNDALLNVHAIAEIVCDGREHNFGERLIWIGRMSNLQVIHISQCRFELFAQDIDGKQGNLIVRI